MGTFHDTLKAFEIGAIDDSNKVVRCTVEEAGERLISRSPVKTGKFASNWNYGLESPDTRVTETTNVRQINNLDEMPVGAMGFVHYLSNALPYGPALERGSSTQAPEGMVGITEKEFPQIVESAVKRVRG